MWLAFQRRASRDFPGQEFNIQLSDEEIEGSASEVEVDVGAEVFSGALDRALLLGDSRVPPGASSSASLARAPLLSPPLPQTKAQRLAFRLFFFFFLAYPGTEHGFCIAYFFYYLLI